MFITKKKHNQIVQDLSYKNFKEVEKTLKETREIYEKEINDLKKALEEAKDLKFILEKFSNFSISGIGISVSGGNWDIELPDNVLQYTEDILGGKVIKQEGTKCLVVDKQGNVKEGLTKQKADKGYSYKLVRE
jgi:hypothetical protein